MHLAKPTECTTQKMNPNVNYGLWLLIMYQYLFINYKNISHQCKILVIREGSVYGNPLLCAQFFCKPKTALKYVY